MLGAEGRTPRPAGREELAHGGERERVGLDEER